MKITYKKFPFLKKSENNFVFAIFSIVILFFQLSSLNKQNKLNFDYIFPESINIVQPNSTIQDSHKKSFDNFKLSFEQTNQILLNIKNNYNSYHINKKNTLNEENVEKTLYQIKSNYDSSELSRKITLQQIFNLN